MPARKYLGLHLAMQLACTVVHLAPQQAGHPIISPACLRDNSLDFQKTCNSSMLPKANLDSPKVIRLDSLLSGVRDLLKRGLLS